MERVPVTVVDGGQAGLVMSHELAARDVEHVVFERGRVAQRRPDRWGSFCLVAPNWTVRRPDSPTTVPIRTAHARDDIVGVLERYAHAIDAPVREGSPWRRSTPRPGGGSLVRPAGDARSRAVVLATGAYQRPHRPATAAGFPADVVALDVENRSPAMLPPGRVPIVGSGQSGCQIAAELHDAGRDMVVACGRVPWAPRRFDGRDIVWRAPETGSLAASVQPLTAPAARPLRRRRRDPDTRPRAAPPALLELTARRERRRAALG